MLCHDAQATAHSVALFSTEKKSRIIAANAQAAAAGVELGMTAPQAVARCAHLLIRTPNLDFEKEARATLHAVGFTLSPLIEDTAPGICTVDLKGFAPEKQSTIANAALAQLHALGLAATAGIARTPLLALYAAQVGPDLQPGRSHPHITPDNPKIGACLQAHQICNETHFLAPLPLAVASPSPQIADVLASWGLRSLGDVTAISCEAFVRRFGAEGLAFWHRAAGGSERPLTPIPLPQTFSAHLDFEHAVETLDPLLFILRRFLDRLSLELQAAHYVAGEIDFTLKLEDGTRHARRFRLPEPTADPEILFRTLHTHLESLRTESCIVGLALELLPVRPLVRQQGLFEAGLRDPHGFAETLARAAALVGSDRVGTPQCQDTHRPDALTLTVPATIVGQPLPLAIHAPLSPILRRLRPPIRANLVQQDNSWTLWSALISGPINHRSKGYPLSGEWWQSDRAWSRIEQDIELFEGGIYRLFRDRHGEWFLEGQYD